MLTQNASLILFLKLFGQKNASDIGGIHSVPPIKIQIDERKLLPNVKQYPLNIEAIRGFKPATEDYLQRN